MAIKKFYSNKAKPGWRENPQFVPREKIPAGEKQKDVQKRYYSWGYRIDLEPVEYEADGTPIRNRQQETGFASRKAAENAASLLKLAEKDEKYSIKKTVFPCISEILQAGANRFVSKKERARSVKIFNRWLKLLDKNIRINELKTAHLKLYVEDRKGKIKDGSINRELNTIASALHGAHLDFPVLEDWICPRIPRLKVKRSRRERLISRDEINRQLGYLLALRFDDETECDHFNRRTVGHAFQMEILTGARLGEIARIRWEHIDWENRILQIHGTKTEYVSASVVRYLELTSTMESILRERQKLNRFGDYVFCRTGNTITHYYRIMEQAARAVGIRYGAGIHGGFVGHDARHTAITRMLQAGIDLATVGSITGHSDKTLILHYSHATRESKRIAGKVLDDFGTVDVENNGLELNRVKSVREVETKNEVKIRKTAKKKGE